MRHHAVALIALAVCVLSQVIAESSLLGDGWDAFGRAIWITILVTLPSFVIACVFAVVALVEWTASRRATGS